MPPDLPMLSGTEAIKAFWQSAMKQGIKAATLETIDVETSGGDLATEIGRFTLSMETPGGDWTDHGGVTLERDTLFTRQANAVLDAIEGKAAPLCSLEEGLATLRANVGILKSADERRWQLMAEA